WRPQERLPGDGRAFVFPRSGFVLGRSLLFRIWHRASLEVFGLLERIDAVGTTSTREVLRLECVPQVTVQVDLLPNRSALFIRDDASRSDRTRGKTSSMPDCLERLKVACRRHCLQPRPADFGSHGAQAIAAVAS